MADISEKLDPLIEPLIEPGEALEGMCVGSRQGLMSGSLVGIAVTDRRVIVQELTRKYDRKGEPLSLEPGRVASAKIGGAGGWGSDAASRIMDKTSLAIRIKTTDGEKLKLMVGKATGPMTGLMGGPTQQNGVQALGDWLDRNGKL